jgi:AcrR family transcriptional regulator
MNKIVPNRRISRSREACLQAFIGLLASTDYEVINVNEVIQRANVGRSTFYDHFTGKEDLLRQCVVNPFAHLAEMFGADDGDSGEGLLWVVSHFREQRRLVKTLLDGTTRTLLVRTLAGLIEERIARTWPASPPARLPAKLAAVSLAEAQLGMILHWLAHSARDCPPQSFADAIRLSSRSAAAHFRGSAL